MEPQKLRPHSDQEKLECKVQEESLHRVIREVIPLSYKHYQEIGLTYPYDPNIDGILDFAIADKVTLITIRYGELLVGYALYLIGPFKHSMSTEYASLEAIYILPAFRNGFLAKRVLNFGEEKVKEKGAKFITVASTEKYPIAKLLSFAGYEPLEVLYVKRLEND